MSDIYIGNPDPNIIEILTPGLPGPPGPPGPSTLPNVTSTPPTPVNGGTLFVQNGALKYIGSNGTVTTLATA